MLTGRMEPRCIKKEKAANPQAAETDTKGCALQRGLQSSGSEKVPESFFAKKQRALTRTLLAQLE
jgi:hypothetical protein